MSAATHALIDDAVTSSLPLPTDSSTANCTPSASSCSVCDTTAAVIGSGRLRSLAGKAPSEMAISRRPMSTCRSATWAAASKAVPLGEKTSSAAIAFANPSVCSWKSSYFSCAVTLCAWKICWIKHA